jgi:hypothetical protein
MNFRFFDSRKAVSHKTNEVSFLQGHSQTEAQGDQDELQTQRRAYRRYATAGTTAGS